MVYDLLFSGIVLGFPVSSLSLGTVYDRYMLGSVSRVSCIVCWDIDVEDRVRVSPVDMFLRIV